MITSIIVATAENGVIGKTGSTPWYLPADLAHFKEITTGRPIIMGRVTHESIGKTLPGRRNIVITHDKGYRPAEGTEVVGSLDEALKLVKGEDEVFIIGGESVYEQALPMADKLYLTKVHSKIAGDRFLRYDPSEWKEISSEPHQADDKNIYDYEFTILVRAN